MQIRLAALFDGEALQKDSIVDGPGLRAVLWTQGCSHNCKGCHNPITHNFDGGILYDVHDIYKEIDNLKYHKGITMSGGDPIFQPEASYLICKYAKKKNLDVWLYTGFTYEEILKMSKKNNIYSKLLSVIDVLIDGKFILEEKSLNLLFRGSSNQRLIDVKETIKNKEIILYKEEAIQKNKEYMFI